MPHIIRKPLEIKIKFENNISLYLYLREKLQSGSSVNYLSLDQSEYCQEVMAFRIFKYYHFHGYVDNYTFYLTDLISDSISNRSVEDVIDNTFKRLGLKQ